MMIDPHMLVDPHMLTPTFTFLSRSAKKHAAEAAVQKKAAIEEAKREAERT